MYKYISINASQSFLINQPYQSLSNQDDASKLKKIQSECNPYESIVRKEDGGVLNGWKLQGVIMLIRHGDRGPMAHVRGINSIDCGAGKPNNMLLNKYKSFLLNTTANAPSGHYIYSKNGPFHNFPLLPAFPKECLLGQLTTKGIAQMLQIGDVLRQVYGHVLLDLSSKPISRTPNTTQSQQMNQLSDEIVIYSTRYRRTFQSAMAMMFSFLSPERWLSLVIRESHSLAFCFADCVCPKAERIKNLLTKQFSNQLNKHPTIAAVVQWIGSNVLQNPTSKMQPLDVRDAILSLICHDAPLPCRRNNAAEYVETMDKSHKSMVASTTESNDLIIIDQDETNNNAVTKSSDNLSNRIIDPDNDIFETEIEGCVETSHVAALMSYTQWQGIKEAQHTLTRQQGLLRAYGMIRHIVANMLKIVSGDKMKFLIYSGHDRTIQFLTTALGLYQKIHQNSMSDQSYFIPYASRFVFEVYKSEAETGDAGEYYFRTIYNGIDVTRQIEFCEGGRSLRINKDSRGNKADLCPIENIVRFIHDDYFTTFNATNQKEACM